MKKFILIMLLTSLFYSPNPETQLYFCPEENCENIWLSFFKDSTDLKCAFYDLDEKYYNYLISLNTSLDLILEKDNQFNNYSYDLDKNPYYMHNKFCVKNNEFVLTGSTNPTINGLNKNNNTIVLIKSKKVAKTYIKEFEELKTKNKTNNQNEFHNLKVYFCPEDNCEEKLIQEIKKAKESIYFATFSFTSKPIATELIYAKKRNITITGVIETRMATNSVYQLLKNQGINVKKDKNPATMHHKLFIIDKSTLITGSYNPTNNGNKRNDENMLILS